MSDLLLNFMRRYREDRRVGRVRSLGEYQNLLPGFEEPVAGLYATLEGMRVAEEPEDSGEFLQSSEGTAGSRLEAFAIRYGQDRERGEVRSLRAYLDEFPANDEAIAREWLVLQEARRGSDPQSPRKMSVVLARFFEAYGADLVSRKVREVAAYRAMFPGCEGLISSYYERLQSTPEFAATGPPASAEGLGPYRLLEEIGRGGQGIVYRAEDTRLRRWVAIKVLRDMPPEAGRLIQRFQREGEVAARLQHPGICAVLEAGVIDATPYIAMHFVPGETLASKILTAREGKLRDISTSLAPAGRSGGSPAEQERGPSTTGTSRGRPRDVAPVVHLFEKAARALHVAHEAGVLHRDIKPGNIMVTPDGEPVILDFGLAWADDVDLQTLTRTGDFFGTPVYMAPERLAARSSRLDRRADIYSLGVSLFECLTCRRPFEAPSREALYQSIISQDPPDLRKLNPSVGRDLKAVVEKSLEKVRDRRYATALAFAEELKRIRDHEPVWARHVTPRIRLQRWVQRNPALAGSIGAASLFLIASLIVSLVLLGREHEALRDRSRALISERGAMLGFQRVSDPALMRQLTARAVELWPRRAEMVGPMEAWLDEARDVAERITGIDGTLEALRSRALPLTDEDRARETVLREEAWPALFAGIAGLESTVKIQEARLSGRLRARRREAEEEKLAQNQERLDQLRNDPRLAQRMVHRFARHEDERMHGALSETARGRSAFLSLIEDVTARRDFATAIRKRSVGDPEKAWERCRDVLKEDAAFAGFTLRPQVGLVPLGRARDSGLFEFWHVGSGDRPDWEGTFLSGRVKVDASSGIVLVLLPGGTFWMGAQADDREQPNYDEQAFEREGPVHEVELSPFFIGKHEVTKGQWKRIMGTDPSFHLAGQSLEERTVTFLDPVEQVTWYAASSFSARLGLSLPTEAQWEYAARGGSTTPWWTGTQKISLSGRVNLADQDAADIQGMVVQDHDLRDGHGIYAPIGALPANSFGLHEVAGNVGELCRDAYGRYDLPAQPGNGLRQAEGESSLRVSRGGSFASNAERCRSASRGPLPPHLGINSVGLRVVQPVL